ncbi:ATP synthase F0 subunit B [Desulfomonile tiedjei]|uniref:ATP synthase subunit b n=1 Tax=Desulfomonile tiedjei (strain ATCC 49306 / DSM 6799 / DCB-1) TaxID=706587 RepID=I4C9W4_DESTA|nr:ATP synthase F0 subunit B [Desulfomonile tiedjei]AFM26355.1 F0F1-type ATP synthase, beta subunit [Desulfomonile tiedjei DSM 6799]
MIQLNFTLFIQLINFLALLFILNAILYKPIMAKMREREAQIRKDKEKALELEQEVREQEKQHQDALAKSRQTAAQEKAALLAEAKAKEAAFLEKARGEASRIVDDMKASIQAEVGEARKTLKTQMTPLAESITRKILGRAIS